MGLCRWRTVEFGPHSLGIESVTEKVLVGSIDLIKGRWHVEILWSGRGGNIRADFAENASALAFVHGVEAAFARMP